MFRFYLYFGATILFMPQDNFVTTYPSSPIPIGFVFDVDAPLKDMIIKQFKVLEYNIGHLLPHITGYNNGNVLFNVSIVYKPIDFTKSYAKVFAEMCNFLGERYLILLAMVPTKMMDIVTLIHTPRNIPVISLGQPDGLVDKYSVAQNTTNYFMYPPLFDPIADYIHIHNWTKAIYIYDSDEGLYNVGKLNRAIRAKQEELQKDKEYGRYLHGLSVQLIRLRPPFETNLPKQLKKIGSNPEKIRRIIVDFMNITNRDRMVQLINQKRNDHRTFHFFIAGDDFKDFKLNDLDGERINISGFHYPINYTFLTLNECNLRSSQRKKCNATLIEAIAFDAYYLAVNSILTVLNQNGQLLDRLYRNRELYFDDEKNLSCFDNRVFQFDKAKFFLEAIGNARICGLMTGCIQFYNGTNIRHNFSIELNELIFNNVHIGVAKSAISRRIKTQWKDAFTSEKIYDEQRHFKGEDKDDAYRVVTIGKLPFMSQINSTSCEGNDCFEGYSVDLLSMLRKEIPGFNYKIHIVKDGAYGGIKNGVWNGMIGELIRGEAEIAIADLTITQERQAAVEFSKPFITLGLSIMLKKAEPTKFPVFYFMSPLSLEIWLYVSFGYLGISLVLYLVSRFSYSEWQVNEETENDVGISKESSPQFLHPDVALQEKEKSPKLTLLNDFSMSNCLWFTIAAFLQQGTEILPSSISGRIAGGVWWFFSLIIVSSYTANLAAFLTLEKMQTPIKNADDLSKQTRIKYGIQGSGSTYSFFEKSQVQTYQRMWQFMSAQNNPSVFVKDYDQGVLRARESNGSYAFILESTFNEYYNMRLPCDTLKIGPNLNSVGYGVATRIGSELSAEINLAILSLQKTGHLTNLANKWWYDKGKCVKEKAGQQVEPALTYDKIKGVFYVLFGGIGVAIITGVVEFLVKSRKFARNAKEQWNNVHLFPLYYLVLRPQIATKPDFNDNFQWEDLKKR